MLRGAAYSTIIVGRTIVHMTTWRIIGTPSKTLAVATETYLPCISTNYVKKMKPMIVKVYIY